MKIFEIKDNKVSEGVQPQRHKLNGTEPIEIWVIGVGEAGRGRKFSFLPVDDRIIDTTPAHAQVAVGKHPTGYPPNPDRFEFRWPAPPQGFKEDESKRVLTNEEAPFPGDVPKAYAAKFGYVTGTTTYIPIPHITRCSIGSTRSGKPKIVQESGRDIGSVLVILRTDIGNRGHHNIQHQGEKITWRCKRCDKRSASGEGVPPKKCPECGTGIHLHISYSPFPGEILAIGVIASGEAGRAASGKQWIAVVPVGSIFLVKAPYHGHQFFWVRDKETIIGGLSQEERDAAELF